MLILQCGITFNNSLLIKNKTFIEYRISKEILVNWEIEVVQNVFIFNKYTIKYY